MPHTHSPDAYFRVIKGRFVIDGYEPDGDSVRFIPDDPSLFEGLRNSHRKRFAKDGSLQLRFEGIDAPELHYGGAAQPLGVEGRDALLRRLGFTATFNGTKVTASTPKSVPGAILTKAFEVHGRPIAYAYTDDDVMNLSGQSIQLDAATLQKSINADLVKSGDVYPLLYTSTPANHRAFFRELAAGARGKGLGVWSADSSADFKLVDRSSVTPPTGALMYPKLFRRIVDYLKDIGFDGDLADWLIANGSENDKVLYQEKIEIAFSDLIRQSNNRVSLQGDILDLVFVEK